MEHQEHGYRFDQPVGDETVIAILSHDLPHMSEFELAELLMNLFQRGPSVVADALVPLARQEIQRRRFIAEVEAIVAAV